MVNNRSCNFHTLFQRLTAQRYQNLVRRVSRVAGNRALGGLGASAVPFTLSDYREWLKTILGGEQGTCPCEYCGSYVTIETTVNDHRLPLSRGGSSGFENLAISCARCNNQKGAMSGPAFRDLMRLLNSWQYADRHDVLHRLETATRLAIDEQRHRAIDAKHNSVRYQRHFEQRL